jgi:hypothetical protein
LQCSRFFHAKELYGRNESCALFSRAGRILGQMPLFDKKPFSLLEPPKDLDSKEKVFQIRFTKEIFRDYEYPFLNDAFAVKFAVVCPGALFANGVQDF